MSDRAPTGRAPETAPLSKDQASPAPHVIEAKGQAETAAVHAAQTAGAAEAADLAPMMEWVMSKADLEAETCFGVPIPDGMLPVELAKLLAQIEADTSLPLETLPDAVVGQLLQTELEIRARDAAIKDQIGAVEASKATLQSYKEAVASVADLPNTEKVSALADDPRVPESERGKLQAFARILAISERFPDDVPVIQARVNALDFSDGVPSPIGFIQFAIFSGPDQDSGVSAAFQQAVAAEFKLTPRRIVTGSDYSAAMAETRLDPNGNRVPVYTKDTPLEFGLGVVGYPSPSGEQEFMTATPSHGLAITLDVSRLSPAGKGIAASYLGMWKVAEDAGETGFLLSLTQYDIRGQSVLDEIDLKRAARIMNYAFGSSTGYDGEILHGEGAVGMLRWQAQLRSPKGDAGQGDTNKQDTRANLQGLGILDKSGRLDEEVLKAFGEFSREHWFSAPGYSDVRGYLRERFPEKFAVEEDSPAGFAPLGAILPAVQQKLPQKGNLPADANKSSEKGK